MHQVQQSADAVSATRLIYHGKLDTGMPKDREKPGAQRSQGNKGVKEHNVAGTPKDREKPGVGTQGRQGHRGAK